MKMNCLNSIGTLRGAESTGRQTTGKTTPAGIWPAHLWKALWFSVGGVQVQVLTLYSTNAPPPPTTLVQAEAVAAGARPPRYRTVGAGAWVGRCRSELLHHLTESFWYHTDFVQIISQRARKQRTTLTAARCTSLHFAHSTPRWRATSHQATSAGRADPMSTGTHATPCLHPKQFSGSIQPNRAFFALHNDNPFQSKKIPHIILRTLLLPNFL